VLLWISIVLQNALPDDIDGLFVVFGTITSDVEVGTLCLSQLHSLYQSISWQPVQVQIVPLPPEGHAPQALTGVTERFVAEQRPIPPGLQSIQKLTIFVVVLVQNPVTEVVPIEVVVKLPKVKEFPKPITEHPLYDQSYVTVTPTVGEAGPVTIPVKISHAFKCNGTRQKPSIDRTKPDIKAFFNINLKVTLNIVALYVVISIPLFCDTI